MKNAGIIGSGIYLPGKIIENSRLEKILGLDDGFIKSRTGMTARRWSNERETIEFMASEATVEAVKDAGIKRVDVLIIPRDAILTNRAHSISLPVIRRLREEGINADGCFSIDLVNYCPGFIHSLHIAELMVKNDEAENIVVVASANYTDLINVDPGFNESFGLNFRKNHNVSSYSLNGGEFQAPKYNAFLWGCGAGAIVVGKSKSNMIHGYWSRGSEKIKRDAYGIGESATGNGFISLDGRAIYRFAVSEVPVFIREFLNKFKFRLADVDIIVPHQPNPRIIKALTKRLGIEKEKVIISCTELGNMMNAAIPVAYHLERRSGKIKPGNKVLFCSFGDSYLTASALLFEER